MTKKLDSVLFSLLMVCISACAPGAMKATEKQSLNVPSVLDSYVKASGGDAFSDVRSIKRKGTLIRGTNGKVPFENISKSPGKWYYNQIFAYGDQVSYGYNGMKAWVCDTKMTDTLSEAERLDLQILFDIQAPIKLGEIYPEMTIKGSSPSSEGDVVTILATSKEGIEKELVFDVKTGLLVRAGDIYFEDYRPEGKLNLPHRIFIGDANDENQLRLKMEISEVEFEPQVDDSVFEKSDRPLPMEKSQLYTLRKQVVVSDEAMVVCLGVYQHPTDPKVQFTVTKQQNHLMIERTGWRNRLEIKPESELDYFVRFINLEFHFVKNSDGKVYQLEIGFDRTIKAKKIA